MTAGEVFPNTIPGGAVEGAPIREKGPADLQAPLILEDLTECHRNYANPVVIQDARL